jgi:4,5-dihydroxyphthalate decarboxylase
VIEANPDLPVALFNAFKQSKEQMATDEGQQTLRADLGAEPFPYGIEPNRKALETMIRYNVEQKLIPTAPKVEDLFHPSTVTLS